MSILPIFGNFDPKILIIARNRADPDFGRRLLATAPTDLKMGSGPAENFLSVSALLGPYAPDFYLFLSFISTFMKPANQHDAQFAENRRTA